jgi:hypothetical protein
MGKYMKNILWIISVIALGACSAGPPGPGQSEAVPRTPADSLQYMVDLLYRAGGDFTRPAPRIRVSDDTVHMAAWEAGAGQIWIEQRAWEVCRQFGRDAPNALAILIGHELGHYYDQARNTSFRAYDRQAGSSLLRERDADVRGVLLAHLAGYEVRAVVPRLLERLYMVYGRAPNPAGYPTLEERRRTARAVSARVDTILRVFEAANMLAATEHYELAGAALSYLQQWYRGGEICHNLGVLYALSVVQAQSHVVPDTFAYPFTLQVTPFLGHPRAELSPDALRQRLQQADDLLQTAALRDARCRSAALLNRACIRLLLGQPRQAINLRTEAAQEADFRPYAWQLIEALVATNNGQRRQAIALLTTTAQEAPEPERSWALRNLALLEHRRGPETATGCPGEPLDFATAQAAVEAADRHHQMLVLNDTTSATLAWYHPPYAVLARDAAGTCAIWPAPMPAADARKVGATGQPTLGWQAGTATGAWQYCRETGWLYQISSERQITGSWRVATVR